MSIELMHLFLLEGSVDALLVGHWTQEFIGRSFLSCLGTVVANYLHPCASKQYNLVPVKGRGCYEAVM